MITPQIDLIKEKACKEEAATTRTVHIPTYNTKTHKMEKLEHVIRSGKEGNSLKRIVIIVAFILLEFIAIGFIYTQFIRSFLWFLIIPYGIGVVFACRVAVGSKNYDSKIAWILFLLILAPVAVFVYLFAGEISMSPLKSRRKRKINENTKLLQKVDIPDTLSQRVRQDCIYLQNTSDYVPYFDGGAEYYPMGENFFENVLTEVKKAKSFIFMDFFILEKGYLTDALFEILIERAKSGVDIRIIVDGLGSHSTLSLARVRKIRKHGIKIIAFEPVIPIINFFINYRNHRKIIVIDGNVGYVGGTNIADEYINIKKRFGTWKDASLRIDGSAVRSLTLMFLRTWEYSTKEKPDYHHFLDMTISDDRCGDLIMPYADGVDERHKLGKAVYQNIITNAKKSLYIMSPYFIVDSGLIDMLKAKAQSGVDVRLIIPGIPDKKIVYALSRANAERLTSSGVRVYLYTPGFLHSKVMLSDDECAVVGSINMDFRSFYQQYESAAYISNSPAITQVVADFEDTFAISKEILSEDIHKRNIFVRIWLAFLRLFAPLM